MTIESYLMGITFAASIIVMMFVAGPGSRLPLFPDRFFFFSLAISLVSATLWYFIKANDPSDTSAKLYSQWINAAARTVVAFTGMCVLIQWTARCRRLKQKAAGRI